MGVEDSTSDRKAKEGLFDEVPPSRDLSEARKYAVTPGGRVEAGWMCLSVFTHTDRIASLHPFFRRWVHAGYRMAASGCGRPVVLYVMSVSLGQLFHRPAGPGEPPAEVVPRHRGAEELPQPPPLPLPPAGQEVSAAGDFAEGPRRLPEAAVPEAAAGKGDPGEAEAGAGGEGERRGAGDQPETRSVCSSRSSSSGGGDQRAGHQHQHHQPICKICFQGAEQGELLNPCRCDGSVRYTHQLCLLKWISERGSWTCELCCYRYHVIAIKMKQPCQVNICDIFPPK
nr:E3 ubiquitin-protein ligase MARCH11-like [Vicugna pacos]